MDLRLVHDKAHGRWYVDDNRESGVISHLLGERDGVIYVRETHFLNFPEVTTTLLRTVSIPEVIRHAITELRMGGWWIFENMTMELVPARPIIRRTPKRPGRRGHGDVYIANVARLYVKAYETGKQPIKELAKSLSKSESAVKNLIDSARKRGLLGETTAGKAGGSLTERALQLLQPRRSRSKPSSKKPGKGKWKTSD